MADLLQLIISGTATGAIYALCALGFTLLWQASGTINFAPGDTSKTTPGDTAKPPEQWQGRVVVIDPRRSETARAT